MRYLGRRERYSLRGAVARGAVAGVIFASALHPFNLGLGESIVDGVSFGVLMTLALYAQSRTRPLVRRIKRRRVGA